MLLEIVFWVSTLISVFAPAFPDNTSYLRPIPLVVAVVCLGIKVFGT